MKFWDFSALPDGSSSLGIPIADRMLHMGVALIDALEDFPRPFSGLVLSGVNDAAKNLQVSTHIISFPGYDMDIQQDALFANFPFGDLDGKFYHEPLIMERNTCG